MTTIARWAAHSADAFFYYPCTDGSGDTLVDWASGADSSAYSGTTTNLWDNPLEGVKGAGDGGFLLPVAVNEIFKWGEPCRVLISFWLSVESTSTAGDEVYISAGPDTGVAGNLPGVGHFRVATFNVSGTKIRPKLTYRNASPDVGAPSNQTILVASDVQAASGGTAEYKHIAIAICSDGDTAYFDAIINGQAEKADFLADDGTGPMNMDSTAGQVCIGAPLDSAGVIDTATSMGLRTPTRLSHLFLWKKAAGTALEVCSLANDLFLRRGEVPRAL